MAKVKSTLRAFEHVVLKSCQTSMPHNPIHYPRVDLMRKDAGLAGATRKPDMVNPRAGARVLCKRCCEFDANSPLGCCVNKSQRFKNTMPGQRATVQSFQTLTAWEMLL